MKIPGQVSELDQVLINASLEETTQLFPASLSDSIRRIPDPEDADILVASVVMSFPGIPSGVQCQMTLDIVPNRVDNLARNLFGVQLETHAGLRYICLPECCQVVPNPKFILRGCRHDVISEILGREVTTAIRENPVYRDELKQRRSRTGCVWMVISHDANEAAEICMSMEFWEGTVIRSRLYP